MEIEMIIKSNITKLEEKRDDIIKKYSNIVKTFGSYAYVNIDEKNRIKNIMNEYFDEICMLNEQIELLRNIKREAN